MLFENVSSRYLWQMTDYQPKYQWNRTQLDENDPPRDTDWMGMDGDLPIGRIRKELHGPVKGKWQWAAWYPKTHKGRPPAPNLGYCATARLATQKVEEFWELCLQVMEPRTTGPSKSTD
jgi:hypothetical protein